MLRRLAVVGSLIGLLWSFAAPARADELRVGSLTLRSCGAKGWCGAISRPLNPAKPTGRRIEIGFKWFDAAGDRSGPPLVAVEGGPGYPSIGSRLEYRGIYGEPLLRTRDLLLVDNRGTGRSARIECSSVQGFAGRTSGPAFARRVGRCANEIDARYGHGAHSFFATAYAADDLAAVLGALRLKQVDLYGDSYGTFFVQDYMARHPLTLHSVILDSAYARRDLDPWYASSGAAARNALETVSPGSVLRLGVLLDRVRAAPTSPCPAWTTRPCPTFPSRRTRSRRSPARSGGRSAGSPSRMTSARTGPRRCARLPCPR
ncbi:MAG TPA: alpha/beta hydrolase [Solirubrobacter sp.]